MAFSSSSAPPTLDDILCRHGLERRDLERKCSAEVRLALAELLNDWKMVGHYLGFTTQKLNDIKLDNDNEEQRRVALLDAWEQQEGQRATYFRLAEAFHHRKKSDLVDKLCGNMKSIANPEIDTAKEGNGVI